MAGAANPHHVEAVLALIAIVVMAVGLAALSAIGTTTRTHQHSDFKGIRQSCLGSSLFSDFFWVKSPRQLKSQERFANSLWVFLSPALINLTSFSRMLRVVSLNRFLPHCFLLRGGHRATPGYTRAPQGAAVTIGSQYPCPAVRGLAIATACFPVSLAFGLWVQHGNVSLPQEGSR